MFGFLGKKCPGCGMSVDEKTGFKKDNKVFCSENCAKELENNGKKEPPSKKKCGCC